MDMELKRKYGRHRIMKYKILAPAGARAGKTAECSLCKKEAPAVQGTGEIICPLCTMGMADAYDPSRAFSQKELVQAIRDRRIKQFRIKYGLTQADLSHFIGISTRQLKRYENLQYSSLDSLVDKVSEKGGDVTSSDSYPSDPQKGDMAVSKNQLLRAPKKTG